MQGRIGNDCIEAVSFARLTWTGSLAHLPQHPPGDPATNRCLGRPGLVREISPAFTPTISKLRAPGRPAQGDIDACIRDAGSVPCQPHPDLLVTGLILGATIADPDDPSIAEPGHQNP
jgi:hypothetical protein